LGTVVPCQAGRAEYVLTAVVRAVLIDVSPKHDRQPKKNERQRDQCAPHEQFKSFHLHRPPMQISVGITMTKAVRSIRPGPGPELSMAGAFTGRHSRASPIWTMNRMATGSETGPAIFRTRPLLGIGAVDQRPAGPVRPPTHPRPGLAGRAPETLRQQLGGFAWLEPTSMKAANPWVSFMGSRRSAQIAQ